MSTDCPPHQALAPAMPTSSEFPYVVRVESLITESCGSSSMASVCGGALSMMAAGVPLKRVVAGVAMGLLLDESGGGGEPIILTGTMIATDDLPCMQALTAALSARPTRSSPQISSALKMHWARWISRCAADASPHPHSPRRVPRSRHP